MKFSNNIHYVRSFLINDLTSIFHVFQIFTIDKSIIVFHGFSRNLSYRGVIFVTSTINNIFQVVIMAQLSTRNNSLRCDNNRSKQVIDIVKPELALPLHL